MLNALSAEFVLKFSANGGTVVFLRSLIISTLVYFAAIGLKSRLAPGATWHFDWQQTRVAIACTIPWFGAIFGGAYVALYARFASQWSYLANLYNQILCTTVAFPPDGQKSTNVLRLWQAGFIEDAEDLHLATKPMFATVIDSMLNIAAVKASYIAHAPGGQKRLIRLEAIVAKTIAQEASKHKK